MKKKDTIRSSGISSLEELKEKKLVTLSPFPSSRSLSQPSGNKRSRVVSDGENEQDLERSVRARSVSRSCLPRKALQSGYLSMMKTPRRGIGQEEVFLPSSQPASQDEECRQQEGKKLESDRVSGSMP